MTYITTIEIDEIETEVSIQFYNHLGDIEVEMVTDLTTGCAIAPELSDDTYNEMHEMAADLMAERNLS